MSRCASLLEENGSDHLKKKTLVPNPKNTGNNDALSCHGEEAGITGDHGKDSVYDERGRTNGSDTDERH